MNTPDHVLATLRTALTKARTRGVHIRSGGFGDCEHTVCAISVLCDPRDEVSYVLQAAASLGITFNAVWALVNGFDEVDSDKGYPEFHAVGAILRKEFIK